MDETELETRLKTAIASAPALRDQAIHVRVEADRVVVEGMVDSAPDRALLGRILRANAGLRTVEDRLRVVRPEPSA
jgi:osmotically-inducible protein OsmY